PVARAPPPLPGRGPTSHIPPSARPPFWTRTKFFAARVWSTTFAARRAAFPRVPNDGAALRANTTAPTVTWIGHATLLFQLEGVNVLTDPQWSERASPVSFAGPKRVTPPGIAFEDLQPIHVVLFYNNTFDHLEVAPI